MRPQFSVGNNRPTRGHGDRPVVSLGSSYEFECHAVTRIIQVSGHTQDFCGYDLRFRSDVSHIGEQLSAAARHALLVDDSPALHSRIVTLRLCWKATQQRVEGRRAAKVSAL